MSHTARSATFIALAACFVLLLAAQPLAAADLTGKWNFTWDTEGGERKNIIEISQKGEALDAKVGENQLAGSSKDGRFKLSGKFHASEAGCP